MQTKALSEYLSIGEAALALGISRDTVKRWEKAGRMRSVRLPNGHRRFRRAEVDALLRASA